MARLNPLLAVVFLGTIASAFLLGASIAAQACPLTDSGIALSQTLRQPDANNASEVARLPGDSKRQSLDYMGVAGLGGVAGLFAIALFSKVRRARNIAPAEAEFLRRYPQFEHPELTLAWMPQEGLPSVFDAEFSVR